MSLCEPSYTRCPYLKIDGYYRFCPYCDEIYCPKYGTLTLNQKREAKGLDPVNRPAHYTDGKIEVIEFIEDKSLGFSLGNVVKYVARAGKKDPTKEVEDLKKAKWYLERRIKELEEGVYD